MAPSGDINGFDAGDECACDLWLCYMKNMEVVGKSSCLSKGVATKFCLEGTDSWAPKPTYPKI